MDEKEVLKRQLQQELQWVQCRQNMLSIMEAKLQQMKQLAELAKQGNLTGLELEELNIKLNNLVAQVNAQDEESRNIENEGIVE
ncbi:hypothetical protein K9O30_15615 [Clostridium bowmanii]|uniref:hypothetical protein n=1 Tax=Clostridium bowmanii TaxID=132925 RepID=UPI001C0E6CD6|nr:hypothetical protein [Clostridium bowmanii]MBU3190594.1 hypothetical protein [Clostridium bowmanii]MCA1075126.1 hypothetical protein [Clostridium bowmanii]